MDILKDIITALNPMFRQRGFIRKGNSFYLINNKNYGIVNFQKSRDRTNERSKFTINFGIHSEVLRNPALYSSHSKLPDISHCQWSARVGYFMADHQGHWWEVGPKDDWRSIEQTIQEIIVNLIFPEIEKRITDAGLINTWLNDTYYGTTEFLRFQYLIVLLNEIGNLDTLHQVVEDFMQQSKGRPNAKLAIEYLRSIKYER